MKPSARHIVCIVNGSRPLGGRIKALLERIAAEPEWQFEVHTTQAAREAIELAREKGAPATHVIAVGGDGTLHEVVNGMLQGGSTAVFGFVPNGTGNDYQRNFGVWSEARWWDNFTRDTYAPVDVCRVEGEQGTRYALNIAGCGFDGHVVSLLNRQREKWKMTGKISYASAILRAFFSYRKPEIEIRADDFTWRGKALMCVACKGSTFGHGLIIAPDARLDSGMLHCVLLGKVSLMDYVRNLSRLKKGQKIEHPEAHYFQTKSLLIELHSGILRQESDGELGGTGSFRFSVEPGRLKLLQTPIS